jgi:hypothetical protein
VSCLSQLDILISNWRQERPSSRLLSIELEVFIADFKERAGQHRDLGTARLIECADAMTAQLLVNDRALRKLCQLAGDRRLVFRAEDESAVRGRPLSDGNSLDSGAFTHASASYRQARSL